ncbi:UNVERIFIED_CONTAM: Beta-glucuronosyltransferase GlcAT14B [Sesamum radiatum]|uniref:Beta-glucuronosyltransferase GlcAT14B n=1 Tax=Sesamum radiatum TaxID=300843 RepID=A0AAW2KJ51_SESRA
MGHLNAEKKWVFPLVISSLVCVFILATSFNMGLVSSVNTINTIFSLFRSRALTNQTIPNFAEAKHPIFTNVGNVYMNEKANMVTYRGPTMVANTLHACAILLKKQKDWDWFINLSASDYPLVTQDDLLYTFSELKRGLNFMEHTSDLGWKATHRAMPLIVDPGLYESTKSDIFWVAPNRNLPTAFKLFTG